jgi:HSP20 family protein
MLVKIRRYPAFDFPSILDFSTDLNGIFGNLLKGEDVLGYDSTLPVGLAEEETRYLITAELPGVRKEDLRISVHEGLVTITAERKKAIPENATWLRNEISTGQFVRTIQVPGEVKVEESSAELTNGVLHLVLPKSEKAKTHEIKVR